MKEGIKNKKQLYKKWLDKYKIVILNEDTFEEKYSIKLTRLNAFIFISVSSIVLILFTTILIALTPLREYIPGYTSSKVKAQTLLLANRTDSLYKTVKMNDLYINSIKKVLSGEAAFESINKDSIYSKVAEDQNSLILNPSKADSMLRLKVDNEDKYNFFESATAMKNFILYPPLQGAISSNYDITMQHYAVDIAVSKGTPVKAIAKGRVLLASWTSDSGYVIIIDHGNQLLSVYKHNGSLTKKQGDLVQAQEVIAKSGSSGEFSSGPHLHFELWNDGNAIDPTNFINF